MHQCITLSSNDHPGERTPLSTTGYHCGLSFRERISRVAPYCCRGRTVWRANARCPTTTRVRRSGRSRGRNSQWPGEAAGRRYCVANRDDKKIANETLTDLVKVGSLHSTIGHFDTTSMQHDKMAAIQIQFAVLSSKSDVSRWCVRLIPKSGMIPGMGGWKVSGINETTPAATQKRDDWN